MKVFWGVTLRIKYLACIVVEDVLFSEKETVYSVYVTSKQERYALCINQPQPT